MTQPNFSAMEMAELRAYVLSHVEDNNEAFYALADRTYASPQTILNSPEDLEQLPEIQQAKQKRLEEQIRQSGNPESSPG
jgi:hypothetical protein